MIIFYRVPFDHVIRFFLRRGSKVAGKENGCNFRTRKYSGKATETNNFQFARALINVHALSDLFQSFSKAWYQI